MVLRTHKTDVNGGLTMIILFGIGAGVMMIINGARLLAHRSDSLF